MVQGGLLQSGQGRPQHSGYFLYGTGSDDVPGNGWNGATALADKDLPNQANYPLDGPLYAVTGTTAPDASGDQNLLTDVGAFTNAYSYYGAFDMTGNVWDWNDLDGLATSVSFRGIRGGGWFSATGVSSAGRFTPAPAGDFISIGFRLASPVPEPATLGIASVGALCACGWWVLKRHRRART